MEKRAMTPDDKYLLALYARKIPLVEAWSESEDRTATLARLKALHGDLLGQVLAEPIVPDVLAQLDAPAAAAGVIAPELVPEAPASQPEATPAPQEPSAPAERVDFRGNPLPA